MLYFGWETCVKRGSCEDLGVGGKCY